MVRIPVSETATLSTKKIIVDRWADFYAGRVIKFPVFFKAYSDFTDILRFDLLLKLQDERP